MRRNYKFHNPEGVYFVSIAALAGMNIFARGTFSSILKLIFIKKIQLFFLCILLSLAFSACNFTKLGTAYTKKEKMQIFKCNTARFNLFMGIRSKEVIRLINLARKDPVLLQKYVRIKWGDEWAERSGIKNCKPTKKQLPYLRPSYLLYFSAKTHAIISGMFGLEGHQGFRFRLFLFGNFNCIFTESGENACYGSWRGIDQFVSWMESSGHKRNMMNPNFCRIGHGGFPHWRYRTNSVQCFSGPKILDVLFRPRVTKKIKGRKD